ncbi:MAG: hypothetical protein NT038_07985 [Euryarchaeota archaeon]|nr:hypothetical protein [Euryarchaeota archaeon]
MSKIDNWVDEAIDQCKEYPSSNGVLSDSKRIEYYSKMSGHLKEDVNV